MASLPRIPRFASGFRDAHTLIRDHVGGPRGCRTHLRSTALRRPAPSNPSAAQGRTQGERLSHSARGRSYAPASAPFGPPARPASSVREAIPDVTGAGGAHRADRHRSAHPTAAHGPGWSWGVRCPLFRPMTSARALRCWPHSTAAALAFPPVTSSGLLPLRSVTPAGASSSPLPKLNAAKPMTPVGAGEEGKPSSPLHRAWLRG